MEAYNTKIIQDYIRKKFKQICDKQKSKIIKQYIRKKFSASLNRKPMLSLASDGNEANDNSMRLTSKHGSLTERESVTNQNDSSSKNKILQRTNINYRNMIYLTEQERIMKEALDAIKLRLRAKTIQNRYRAYLFQKQQEIFKVFRGTYLNKMASKIQKCYLEHVQTKLVNQKAKIFVIEQKNKSSSIQNAYRNYIKFQRNKAQLTEIKRNAQAKRIQKHFKNFLFSKVILKDQDQNILNTEILDDQANETNLTPPIDIDLANASIQLKSAEKIQATFRGFMQRKQLKLNNGKTSSQSLVQDIEETLLVIQQDDTVEEFGDEIFMSCVNMYSQKNSLKTGVITVPINKEHLAQLLSSKLNEKSLDSQPIETIESHIQAEELVQSNLKENSKKFENEQQLQNKQVIKEASNTDMLDNKSPDHKETLKNNNSKSTGVMKSLVKQKSNQAKQLNFTKLTKKSNSSKEKCAEERKKVVKAEVHQKKSHTLKLASTPIETENVANPKDTATMTKPKLRTQKSVPNAKIKQNWVKPSKKANENSISHTHLDGSNTHNMLAVINENLGSSINQKLNTSRKIMNEAKAQLKIPQRSKNFSGEFNIKKCLSTNSLGKANGKSTRNMKLGLNTDRYSIHKSLTTRSDIRILGSVDNKSSREHYNPKCTHIESQEKEKFGFSTGQKINRMIMIEKIPEYEGNSNCCKCTKKHSKYFPKKDQNSSSAVSKPLDCTPKSIAQNPLLRSNTAINLISKFNAISNTKNKRANAPEENNQKGNPNLVSSTQKKVGLSKYDKSKRDNQ